MKRNLIILAVVLFCQPILGFSAQVIFNKALVDTNAHLNLKALIERHGREDKVGGVFRRIETEFSQYFKSIDDDTVRLNDDIAKIIIAIFQGIQISHEAGDELLFVLREPITDIFSFAERSLRQTSYPGYAKLITKILMTQLFPVWIHHSEYPVVFGSTPEEWLSKNTVLFNQSDDAIRNRLAAFVLSQTFVVQFFYMAHLRVQENKPIFPLSSYFED